ncbi:MAG: LacI family transcriptional regulator, repressor for deo operon, udp, cdd, tsx, nupC, and nupG [Halanaerobiales bacterium]|nr:LacI family transcriptional regulator, repressor for deo operon, udp, cdd, tsx, nupC, and nupG [Halanaerobiales bacterium]
MAKMSDVAKKANVSIATVSRVFSSPETVAEETKKKVLKVVEELNYTPNVLARQLRKMETKTIVVVVPDITNTFFSRVLRGIETIARENGYRVLLGDTENDITLENEYLKTLYEKHADGLILLTARTDRITIEKLSENYPVVLACEYLEGSNLPTVSIDNISAARKATEHLIKLGHRRIAHITGPMNVILSRDRLKGYKQAMESYELEVDPILIQEGDFYYKTGYNLMLKLLFIENPPTAVFAANDEMAIGAIKAIQSQGLKVPEDIAIVGFDNIKMSAIFSPSLTTIGQPTYKIGEKAMNLLLDLIRGKKLSKNQFVLDDKLIIRESCGFKND